MVVVALFQRYFALQSRAGAILSVILRYFALNVGTPKCRPKTASKCKIQITFLNVNPQSAQKCTIQSAFFANVHFLQKKRKCRPKSAPKCTIQSVFLCKMYIFSQKNANVNQNQLQNVRFRLHLKKNVSPNLVKFIFLHFQVQFLTFLGKNPKCRPK